MNCHYSFKFSQMMKKYVSIASARADRDSGYHVVRCVPPFSVSLSCIAFLRHFQDFCINPYSGVRQFFCGQIMAYNHVAQGCASSLKWFVFALCLECLKLEWPSQYISKALRHFPPKKTQNLIRCVEGLVVH